MTIKVTELTKAIGNNTVLDNVSLEAMPYKITGICGVNGSGKTMLFRALAGLIKPTQGTIEINGRMLWKDMSFPESIGILIEHPSFLNRYSGFKNLELIASVKGIAQRDQIRESMLAVGLDPENGKKYRKYSLGMKQRLGIAAAVMERPAIILLDEPTNALDAEGVEMLKRIAIDERDRGAIVILSCHDKDVLRALSDEIYHFVAGKVVDHEYL